MTVATVGYRQNGVAARSGMPDLVKLRDEGHSGREGEAVASRDKLPSSVPRRDGGRSGKMKRSRWSEEETELLLDLVRKHERLDVVASEFGCSVEDLRGRLRELGIAAICRRVVVKRPADAGA